MSKIIELRNKRASLLDEIHAFIEANRQADQTLNAEHAQKADEMMASVKNLGKEIERLEALRDIEDSLNAATSAPVRSDVSGRKAVKATATPEYSRAFWDMMRGNNTLEVRDALSVGTGSAGGYTVPDEFERQLVQSLDENNVFRRIAKVIRTQSGTRTIPIATDSGSASWIEEGTSIDESDVSFDKATLSAYKLGCLIKVSNELLNDSAFDIAAHIAQRFGVRFGNAEENAFLNGTGPSATPGTPSQPTGILTTLTANTTAGSAVDLSFDDMYKLYYSLKAPYRSNAAWVCSESVMLKLMMLKDGNSNYVWKPSLEVGKPDTFLGHPIYTSQYMPGLTGTASQDKNKKVVLFGDFSYYWIADRQNRTVKRLNELYAATDQVGFLGTQRVDGKLILGEACQALKMGATA
nr:phage major capsid protein [Clostridia bacterium]